MAERGFVKLSGREFAGASAVAHNKDLAEFETAEQLGWAGGRFTWSLYAETPVSRSSVYEREAQRLRKRALQNVS